MEDPSSMNVGRDGRDGMLHGAAPATHDENEDGSDMDDVDDGMNDAAAAAQVALMDGHFNNRTGRGNQGNRVAEEAVLGASTDDVEAYMDQDESGTLVEQRFLQFLESL